MQGKRTKKNTNTAWRADDRKYMWHPYSRYSDIMDIEFPVITHARGGFIYDAGERRYFDAISSWWACNLGHGQPAIVKAIQGQSEILQHSILGNLSHPPAIELAEMLAKTFKGKPRRVFFAGDGASAVEAALKIAAQYRDNLGIPRRNRFVSLEQAYHGDTIGAVSLGYQPHFHRPFRQLLFKTLRAPAPCCADCAWGRTPAKCRRECFAPMRDIITSHAGSITAVIFESLCQGAAGMRIYHPDYLRQLARLCRQNDILLIADEIAMGMGRTGKMWAFEHAGIDPDIVCVGKGLSGGYLPISAAVVKDEIYQTFRDKPDDHTFYHGHTFGGNPMACAAAIATLKIYRQRDVVRQAFRNGRELTKTFAPIARLPGVKNIRCLGMIAACELDNTAGNATTRARQIRLELMNKGILIRPLGNVIYLMPPLLTPPATLRRLVKVLHDSIAATAGHKPSNDR